MASLSDFIVAKAKYFWLKRQKVFNETFVLAKAIKMPVLPTRFGLAMIAVLVVMFIWSANHQLNLGYLLTFLMATVVMLSAGLTVSYLAGLAFKVVDSPAVFLGEDAVFYLLISELNGRERAAFKVKNSWWQSMVAGIEANATVEVAVREPTLIRGWHQLGDIEVSTTLPLGFFISWQWFYLKKRLLVYPAPKGDLPLPYQVVPSQGAENALAIYGDDEFAGLKAYVLGDSLSRVAWKQAGRGEGLLLKVFHGQGAQTLVLDYQGLSGDEESRLSQLTKWVLEAEQAHIPYTLVLPQKRIEQGLGEVHRRNCLQALALFNLKQL